MIINPKQVLLLLAPLLFNLLVRESGVRIAFSRREPLLILKIYLLDKLPVMFYHFCFATLPGNPMKTHLLGNLFVEAAVVGVVCIIFLILFVVAGIRQIYKNRE